MTTDEDTLPHAALPRAVLPDASREVGPITADVDAPAPMMFQMLAAIGQGAQPDGDRAEVLRRDGDDLVCDFWTTVPMPLGRARRVRSREAVRLSPPGRIDYEHLDGPVRGLRESIEIEVLGPTRSRLVYRGTYPEPGRLAGLAFRVLGRAAIERTMVQHFDDLRTRAEERFSRSRVFPRGASQPDDENEQAVGQDLAASK